MLVIECAKKKREEKKITKPPLEQNANLQMGTLMEKQLWDVEAAMLANFLTQTSSRIFFSKHVQVRILCHSRRKFPTIWKRQVKSEKPKTCFSPRLNALL